MNKTLYLLGLIFCMSSNLHAQNTIEWQAEYPLQISDFQSPSTKLNQKDYISISGGGNFSFAYQMSNGVFMFTKNFNSMVHCTFQRDAAALVAPDTATAMNLLNFARYQFDLAELYARKLRKALYEKKNAFSGADFFQPAFDSLQAAFQKRLGIAQTETHLGANPEKLQQLHQEVLLEIAALPDYCASCKPKKKHHQRG